jgi:hypothetical protein
MVTLENEALAEAARTDARKQMRELQQSIEEHARYMPS